jgi:Ca2+-binding RTX toxin-like protein
MANINGTSNNDNLTGTNAADLMQGLAGNDSITGLEANDTLNGGTDDDTLIGGDGYDRLAGEGGNDSLNGGYKADRLDGGDGNDSLDGGTDNDTLYGDAGNDSLMGNSESDILDGGIGNDILDGGTGDDSLRLGEGNDTIIGGTGNDSLDLNYTSYTNPFSVNYTDFNNGYTDFDNNLATNEDKFKQIERLHLYSGSGSDNINLYATSVIEVIVKGNGGNDTIKSGTTNDILYGGDGNDSFDGGDGKDAIFGEEGNDYINGGIGNDDRSIWIGGNYYSGLYGGDGDDTIDGNSGDDYFNPGEGIDSVIGGTGNDSLDLNYGSQTSDFTVNYSNANSGTVSSKDIEDNVFNEDSFKEIETINLVSSRGNDSINLSAVTVKAIVDGNEGDDTITSGTPNDILYGRDGNDNINGGDGTDAIFGEEGNDYINGGIGNDDRSIWIGGNYYSGLYGGDGDDTIDGGAGNDTLDGGAGNDTLSGGAGNDIYVVDANGDVVTETSTTTTEIDTVQSGVTYTLGANLENLSLTGNAAINGTGNSLNNAITGNAAANTLDGGAGNDTLNGGAGNDTYIIDSTSDVVSETPTTVGEIDTVQSNVTHTLGANLENITLTGTNAINANGNALNNKITGNIAANTLDGSSGADSLYSGFFYTEVDGIAGYGTGDTILNNGNDTYIVDHAGDKVKEFGSTASTEVDTVKSSVTFTLTNPTVADPDINVTRVENLELTGTAVINGTGNALNNKITGNIAANTLDGAAGNDTLTGEAGVDRFLYDTNAVFATSAVGIDTITDFAVGTDKIVLDKTTFTALQSVAGNAFSVVSDFAIVSADSLAGASSGLIVYSSATDNLFYNPDGTTAGLASGGQFATLSGIDSLSASDFVIQA